MRVLVVEDEAELRAALGRRLRADGHGVDEAESGDSAESFLASYAYDAMIVDRMLPDGDAIVHRIASRGCKRVQTTTW